ncbi:hypothetical protein [Halorussus marinus]|uniref:hypothetical protein n=1 Tax=Halorussus marinus TaxID=2505976 RepID=UPI00106EAE77|nr:hypothetical protein [Halorussus marinus]
MNIQSIVMEVIANFVFQAVMLVVQVTLAVLVVALVGWVIWTAVSMTVGSGDDDDVATDRT